MDQRNRTDSPETKPHAYGKSILDRGAMIHNGKKTAPSARGVGKARQPHVNQ